VPAGLRQSLEDRVEKVKIGNKVFDSFDQPIAVLLADDQEREAAVRMLQQKGRAFGSFPMNYDRVKAGVVLNEGWGEVSYKVGINAGGLLSKLPFPDVPKILARRR
jgi:hypothetical protein